MIKRSEFMFFIAMSAMVMIFIGCGSSEETVATKRYVWPELPDSPRVEYFKTIRGEADFAGGISGVLNSITGSVGGTNLSRPYDICFGEDGVYYITDVSSGLLKYDSNTKKVTVLGENSSIEIKDPRGVAYSHGKIYVGLTTSKKVAILDSTGNAIGAIGHSGRFPNPVDIVIDSVRGRVYIVDIKLDQIFVCNEKGDSLFTIGKSGSADGQFNFPQSAALDSSGNLYVVDGFNFRVQVFDTSGNFVRKFGRQGDVYGAFARPKGIALDSFGNIYVIDAVHQHFQIFNNAGELLMYVGKYGPGNNGFENPISIAIDKTNKIFVTDNLNSRVQVFQLLQGN